MEELDDKPTVAAQGIGAFLIAWSGLYCLFEGLIVWAKLASRESDDPNLIALLTLFAVAYAVEVIGGVALVRGKAWARGVVLLGAGSLVVALLAHAATEAFDGWTDVAFLIGPTALVVPFLLSGRIRLTHNEKPRDPINPRHVGAVAVLVTAIAFLVGARDEIRTVLWDLRYERWADICEDDPLAAEACGRSALRLIERPKSFEDMKAGIAMLESLCQGLKIHRSCEIAASLREPSQQQYWYESDHFLVRERLRVAREACRARDPRGCGVLMAQGELDDQERRIVEEACRAGDSRACVQWFAFAEDPKEVEAPACAASRRASCDATAFCLDGHYDVCGSNSDPVATALTALGPHSKTNPALYQVQVEVDDLAAHCDNGSAAACFLMGLNATADIDPFENGTVPVRSLEVSMGTACNMGANIACYVFALRLLDRDFSGERDTVRARELLDLGCQRGHAESCQLLVSEVLDIRADFDSAIEASRRASITWGVAYWMFVQPLEAYQLGAVPWPVMDSISIRAEEQGCLDANALRQCEWAADARLRLHHGQVGPLWVRTASVAGRACRAGRPAACRTLMRLADFAADFGMTPRAELEKSICSQLPAACSTE